MLSDIAHPVLLLILLIVNIPVFISLARAYYRDPTQVVDDIEETVARAANSWSGSWSSPSDRDNYPNRLKAIFFVLVCASFIKMEYMLIVWMMK